MNRVLFLLTATIAPAASLVAKGADGMIPCPGAGVSPHIAFGGGWSTTIYVNVISLSEPRLTFRFYDATGNPLQVPFSTTSGLRGTVSVLALIPAGRKVEAIELLGTDAQTSIGWVVAQCSGDSTMRLQISEVFRHTAAGRPDFEASVPFTAASPASPVNVVFPFDSRNGLETGLAVVKMRTLEVGEAVPIIDTVGIICWTSAVEEFRKERLLSESTLYGAWTLSSLLPETVGKAGSCSVFGRTGDTFQGVPSIIGLRFTPGGAFSTVPIGSID